MLCLWQLFIPLGQGSVSADSTSLQPLPPSEQEALNNWTDWVATCTGGTDNGGSTCCTNSSSAGLVGSDNVQRTFNFFVTTAGLSPAQAAGVTANFMWESGGGVTVDPLVGGPTPPSSPGPDATWGIAQWTGDSINEYVQDKQSNNITGEDSDLLTQLEVVWAEMQGKGSFNSNDDIVPGLKQITDAGDAATYFRANFERCDTSNSSCTTDRVTTAGQVLQEYGGGAASSSSSSSSANSTSTSTSNTASGGCDSATSADTPGTVQAAVAAARELSNDNIPYSTSYRTLTKTPQSGGYDCSASVSWVLLTAGFSLPDNATWGSWAPVSGDFSNWGDPGPGNEMTVWESSDHVFIEFNVPGVGHYQLNTSYSSANGHSDGQGPQFFPWGQNGEADAASGGFQARHWPGT